MTNKEPPVVLIAFDFDHTIVEENSDAVIRNLVKDEEALSKINETIDKEGWTAYMRKIFEILHEREVTTREIKNAIGRMDATAGFENLLKKLGSKNGAAAEIIIISDSNFVFIKHWLTSRNLDRSVDEIYTHPSWIDDDDKLNIVGYHVQDSCDLSERTMCKGQILESHIQKRSSRGINFERIVYVGDGKNDFCPILRLTERDLAFPRENYSLMSILQKPESDPKRIPRAKIIPWSHGDQILDRLLQLIPSLGDYH